jgi:hypothetical protein
LQLLRREPLIPRLWLRDRVGEGLGATALARVFDVSPAAMSARLRELGLAT